MLCRSARSRCERLDRLTPCGALAVVDLAQIKHVSLHRPPAGYPAVLDNAPIAVLLAVLAAQLVALEHGASLPKQLAVSQGGWSAPQPVLAGSHRLAPRCSELFSAPGRAKFLKSGPSCESRAKLESLLNPAGFTNERLRIDCGHLGFLPFFAFRILLQNRAERQ